MFFAAITLAACSKKPNENPDDTGDGGQLPIIDTNPDRTGGDRPNPTLPETDTAILEAPSTVANGGVILVVGFLMLALVMLRRRQPR